MAEGQKPGNPNFSGELDPEIAELMDIGSGEDASLPGYSDLFDEPVPIDQEDSAEVDLTRKSFDPITRFEDKPKPYFNDKDYYKKAIGGEPEAQRFHEQLSLFLSSQDPKDKSLYRGKIMASYWNMAAGIASKAYRELPIAKLLTLRYGLVLPTLLSDEHREVISKIIFENGTGEPVHYVDEWLKSVGTGQVSSSATDEVKPKKRSGTDHQLLQKIEHAKGQRDIQIALINNKMSELEGVEAQLKANVEVLCRHGRHPEFSSLKAQYTAEQRSVLTEITNILRQITVVDKDISAAFSALNHAANNVKVLKEKAAEAGEETVVDTRVIVDEFNTIRQMIKLAVGRQGTTFLF